LIILLKMKGKHRRANVPNDSWKEIEHYLIKSRYALRVGDGDPAESTYTDVISRVTHTIFSPSFSSKCPSYLQDIIQQYESDLTLALFEKKIVPATPALINIGSPADNKSYFSCYPFGPVPDSLAGILSYATDAAKVFQAGGGVGIDISDIRAKGARCANNQCTASGPLTFLNIFDVIADVVKQGGRRRGAFIATMESIHPDFLEFITLKSDQPGSFKNMNLSIVLRDSDVNNKNLLKFIAESIYKCGDPGVIFLDNAIKETPIPEELKPWYVNPCGEYLSVPMTACNLISLNLNEIFDYSDTDYTSFYSKIYNLSKLACLLGNILIYQDGGYPVLGIKQKTQELRPVGIGMMGLHEVLEQLHIAYDSNEGIEVASKIQQAISLGSMEMSADITLEGINFPASKVPCRRDWMEDFVAKHEGYPAAQIQILKALEKRGSLHNIVTTSQPPTGSISQLVHCFSPGIEPIFDRKVNRKVKDENNNWLDFELESQYVDMSKAKTSLEISGEWHLKMLSAIQQFCHTGISKTINVSEKASVGEIADLLNYAHQKKLKSVTVYRDMSKSEQVLTKTDFKNMQTGFRNNVIEKPLISDPHIENAARIFKMDFRDEFEMPKTPEERLIAMGILSPDREKFLKEKISKPIDLPSIRKSMTFALRGIRHCYIHTTLHEGRVVEVFIDTGESGTNLHAANQALGRILSIALRSNASIKDRFIKTLRGIDSGNVYILESIGSMPTKRYKSIPDAIADILTHPDLTDSKVHEISIEELEERTSDEPIRDECPECGLFTMVRRAGCKKCLSCNYELC